MEKIGFIINPVAGIGGRVGLKGSDGLDIQRRAFALGARAEAPRRAAAALAAVAALRDTFTLYSAPGEMGAEVAREQGFEPVILGEIEPGATRAADTIAIARLMEEKEIDLILFAGGDGTARNIHRAVGNRVPVLGIPAGVKIHSAVYAINPQAAGKVLRTLLTGGSFTLREAEVMDIDEAAFRRGRVQAALYGYMRVPEERRLMQGMKSGGYFEQEDLSGLAAQVVDDMEPGLCYLIGPGTTTRAISEALGLPFTLLGVDAVCNGKLLGRDLNEEKIGRLLARHPVKLVLTVIGGQGHLFGRGNQQLSPRLLRQIGRDQIIIVATRAKLHGILPRPLLTDTGDEALDRALSGWYRVITGYGESMMFKLEA